MPLTINHGREMSTISGNGVVLFSFNVSYYLKSDNIWILFLDLVGNSEVDLQEGPGVGNYF